MRQVVAFIREAECIGCTKCLPACPVDAITGSAKLMHTIITSECIGCELCIAPCPVDCIEMQPIIMLDMTQQQQKLTEAKRRFQAHKTRIRLKEQTEVTHAHTTNTEQDKAARQAYLAKLLKNR